MASSEEAAISTNSNTKSFPTSDASYDASTKDYQRYAQPNPSNSYQQSQKFSQYHSNQTTMTKSFTKRERVKRFTWQFIWSFFMQNSTVRAWLFQRERPSRDQVVKALYSKPILVGYVFGHVFGQRTATSAYPYPDIGELMTVHDIVGDVLLGFPFGYQNVHPLLVHTFRIIKDPTLSNPRVVSRRFARQRCPIPGSDCYFTLEMTWFESGLLAVTTGVIPTHQAGMPMSIFEEVDFRVFSVNTATKLAEISDAIDEDPNRMLPKEFLDPRDNYYRVRIAEPDDCGTDESDVTSPSDLTQAKQIPSAFSPHDINLLQLQGANVNSNDVPSTTKTVSKGIHLWSEYVETLTLSKRRGLLASAMSKYVNGQEVPIYGRVSQYTFLITSGINASGRIQRLCNQLGLDYTSPYSDSSLLSNKRSLDLNSSITQQKSSTNNYELDLTKRNTSNQSLFNTNMITNPALLTFEPTDLNKNQILPTSSTLRTDMGKNTSAMTHDMRQSQQNPLSTVINGQEYGHNPPSPKRRRCNQQPEIITPVSGQEIYHSFHPRSSSITNNMKQETRSIANFTNSAIRTTRTKGAEHDFRRTALDIGDIISYDKKVGDVPEQSNISSVPEISFQPMNTATTSSTPSIQVSGTIQTETKKFNVDGQINMNTEASVQTKGSTVNGTGSGSKTVWTCDRCGVQIRGKKGNLNRHIANKHENIRAYACTEPNCGRKFQTRLNLVRHEKAVHQGRPFVCPECPRAFKYENDLSAHMKTAHMEKNTNLACDICGSCFGRRSTLNRHKAKVHKLSPSTIS